MSANDKQVAGTHYKTGGEEHWDRVARLKLDYFQGQITKYVERCWKKNGIQDLEKAQHFLEKYIEISKLEKEFHDDVVGKPDDSVAPEVHTVRLGDIFKTEDGDKYFINELRKTPYAHGTIMKLTPDLTPYVERFNAARGIAPVDFTAVGTADSSSIVGNPRVHPTGWRGFTFEGCSANWELYRCMYCRKEVRVGNGEDPATYHKYERVIPLNEDSPRFDVCEILKDSVPEN